MINFDDYTNENKIVGNLMWQTAANHSSGF